MKRQSHAHFVSLIKVLKKVFVSEFNINSKRRISDTQLIVVEYRVVIKIQFKIEEK